MQEEIDVFEGLFPLAGIVPRYVTEVDAVNLLLKDSLRLAITSRRLTPEEMNSFNSRKFFPQEIKIATDGLALITHLGNPDSLISVKDIRRILTALDTGDYGAILRAKGIVPSGGKWLHFDYVPRSRTSATAAPTTPAACASSARAWTRPGWKAVPAGVR